jgi:hypothetical protein
MIHHKRSEIFRISAGRPSGIPRVQLQQLGGMVDFVVTAKYELSQSWERFAIWGVPEIWEAPKKHLF